MDQPWPTSEQSLKLSGVDHPLEGVHLALIGQQIVERDLGVSAEAWGQGRQRSAQGNTAAVLRGAREGTLVGPSSAALARLAVDFIIVAVPHCTLLSTRPGAHGWHTVGLALWRVGNDYERLG